MADPRSLLDQFKQHHSRSVNGLPCKSACPICAKRDADALGHAEGTFPVPIDTYDSEVSQ